MARAPVAIMFGIDKDSFYIEPDIMLAISAKVEFDVSCRDVVTLFIYHTEVMSTSPDTWQAKALLVDVRYDLT